MVTIEGREIFTGYVKLENSEYYQTKVPLLHPDDPRYVEFWSRETRRCVEGLWVPMFDGYRFMRGNLYFYGNYTVLQETNRNKVTSYVRPSISDLEWELSYGTMVARGFSGFSDDEQYTSLRIVQEYAEAGVKEPTQYLLENFPSAINKDGKIKMFVDPLDYVRRIHPKKLGKPLFLNETQNFMALGSRGGGKSYYFGLGEVEHGLLFDGATAYDKNFVESLLTAEFIVGSGDTDKSSEFATKIKASIDALASPKLGRQFGVWGSPEDSDFTPCPFYRDMEGSLTPPNKKNPYRHEYMVEQQGRWIPKGTGTKLYHVSYSSQKGGESGAQAGAGGRYLLSVIEESGLTPNIIEVHNSNDSSLAREGVRFGTEIYIGTSGNLNTVQGTKKLFLNPQDYNILPYKNTAGTEGKDGMVGFFLPFYMTLRQFKDKHGNTDYAAAAAHVTSIRTRKRKSDDPNILRKEKMNRPCFIEEMWVSQEGSLLPYDELVQREQELMSYNKYKSLETPVKLIWDSSAPQGVRYEVDHDAEPYRDFPLDPAKRKIPQGCPVIFDPPRQITGQIPSDLYSFVGHDPYVEEDINSGGSIGSTYILMNPKYIPMGLPGNIIVASYIDKPLAGLDSYYETQEKLLALYGNPPQGLWFEKNRGQDCRAYYIRKNKAHLLATTPQHIQGSNIYQRNITSYGYIVGSRTTKLQLAKMLRDWLLEETELPGDGVKRNVDRIPCLYLIRQMKEYNLDDNFDAVDGFRGCVLGLRDYETKLASEQTAREARGNSAMFSRFLNNPKIFKHARRFS